MTEKYCRCSRWRQFTHHASEHDLYESRAWSLTPRRYKRETGFSPTIPTPLEAEVTRLRAVMRRVYEDGISRPGNACASVVEPLWKELHRPVAR